MQSTARALGIPELLEGILLQLDTIEDIIRVQRVSKRWRSLIIDSPLLQAASWYSHSGDDAPTRPSDPQAWKLNPVLPRLGVGMRPVKAYFDTGGKNEGEFSLTERIYDLPGSWTHMLATEPPCWHLEVECWGNYSGDQTMYYEMESLEGPLLLGDIMAVLAECQNRQDHGVDRWAGVRHYSGSIHPITDEESRDSRLNYVLVTMGRDVSIRVAVYQAWDEGVAPAFSLRRVYPRPTQATERRDTRVLHELIVHDMVFDGETYEWEAESHGGRVGRLDSLCKTGAYMANLVAVKDYGQQHVAACQHIFRLLSQV